MVCCGIEMDRSSFDHHDSASKALPPAEPTTCNRGGTAWWKLARPTLSRRRRSSLVDNLSVVSPAPSAADRLFEYDHVTSSGGYGDGGCCYGGSGSMKKPVEPWTCSTSKADTEAPTPFHDCHDDFQQSPRQRREGYKQQQQQPHSQLRDAYGSAVSACSDGFGEKTSEKRHPLLLLSVGSESPRTARGSGATGTDSIATASTTAGRDTTEDRLFPIDSGTPKSTWSDVEDFGPSTDSTRKAVARDAREQRREELVWKTTKRTPSKKAQRPRLSSPPSVASTWNNDGDDDNSCYDDTGDLNGTSCTATSTATDMASDDNVDNYLGCDERAQGSTASGGAGGVAGAGAGAVGDKRNLAIAAATAAVASRESAREEPNVVYDILAVDRGCGYCDTSVVPFPVDEREEVSLERIRAVTAGQGEFLARRGFAAGLVSHFLEETNSEFRVLQGGASRGMTEPQLEKAAVKLEEVFVPAVKKLRRHGSMDIVLDSLFEGTDDAGQFVVRFEVTITRCHPEDLDASTLPALRECAPAIRDAVRDEGVAEHAAHEVVFVGRPMWELVPPVLDLSSRG